MEVVAHISTKWRQRMFFMFCMVFGIAAWFLYDGYILWPDEAQRHAEYLKIKDTLIEAGDAVDEETVLTVMPLRELLRMQRERHIRNYLLSLDYTNDATDSSTSGPMPLQDDNVVRIDGDE